MSKIITIGSACQDIFFPTNEGVLIETPDDILSQKKIAFELGAKYAITERFETLGGNSINVAVGLAKLGENVSAYAAVGDDAVGKWIVKELEKTGVAIKYVSRETNCKSDLSSIVVDADSCDRVIFTSHAASGKLVFDGTKINSPSWIFIGDLSGDWKDNIDRIIEAARQKKSWLAFNPRQKTIHDDVKKIIETIAHCEMLIVNKDEAIEIVNGCGDVAIRELLESEEYLIKVLRRLGSRVVALTDGINGAWAYD